MMGNTSPLGSKDNPGYVKVTNTPELQLAYAEVAHPHAKGIIYNGTMKPSIANKYKSEGYSFCMRSLNTSTGSSTSGSENTELCMIPLTAQETNRITGASDKHGYGLALMPFYILNVSNIVDPTSTGSKNDGSTSAPAENTPVYIAAKVIDMVSEAAIPIGTTVWLQLQNTGDGTNLSLVQQIEQQIFQSGYSVGILGDEVQQQQQTNGRVLESTYTPFEQSASGTQIRTIAIGDNTGSYPIYWAIQ
ncbi:hypothetical protein N473_08190 [Pseudoalteromonas luteoviolacea CPMOR-1]|uniref:Uncharacterized protein n=1 Tax=Pseudoalteromonas luteoviolacea CPMOR-1 TaxID=1365248 RepID=A0A167MZI8_9GAMM|nr:hypothetical protein [Pseudoalteromonas luteoviolacea]KZN67191.1 hypothetical protein N473_08190 [Pseudoalteromonas luteoviolacea CPMOR-1]